MGEVSLEMLLSLSHRLLDEQAATRREVGEVRALVLRLLDTTNRIDRRIGSAPEPTTTAR